MCFWKAPIFARERQANGKKLNLPSDSSYRFERGVDPAMILPASQRATELIRELASGNPSPEIVTAGELPTPPKDVSLRYERCNRLIGLPVPRDRVDQILDGFGLKYARNSEGETSWHIPSHRSDLQREADLIEEVVRVFGIERVPVPDRSRFTPVSEADRTYDFESAAAAATGRSRACGSAHLGADPAQSRPLRLERARVAQSSERRPRRPSADSSSGLMDVLARNIRAGASSIRLFELGHVFCGTDAAEKRTARICSLRKRGEQRTLARPIRRDARLLRSERRDRDQLESKIFPSPCWRDPTFTRADVLSG